MTSPKPIIDREKGVIYLTERQRTEQLIKPILRGRDIKRYSYEWAGLWIINTHNGYTTCHTERELVSKNIETELVILSDSEKSKNTESKTCHTNPTTCHTERSEVSSIESKKDFSPFSKAQNDKVKKTKNGNKNKQSEVSLENDKKQKIPPIDINDYPALKAHLDTHWDKIAKRADKGETPYNLRNCAYLEEFAKEKIVYSEIVKEPQFYLDSGEFKFGSFYAEATNFILSGNENFKHSLHYLLGILHSKLITYAFKEFYAGGGLGESGYRYKKVFLERLPIPKVDSKTEAEFIQIVQEIVESKKQGRDTKELESTLDAMVCKLYNLSQAEADSVLSLSLLVALLLVAALQSKARNLANFVLDNFEKELCEAFRFCEGLKLPQREYQGKIIYPNMAKEFIAHLDTQGFFTNQKCFILTDKNGENLHYLTAILNSKANFWYFKQIGATLGASGYEMSKIFVEKLPIPQITESNKPLCDEIIKCVEQILSLQGEPEAIHKDTKELESKIDSLVYKLYNLSNDEIATIES